jgi:hypothetical protein
MNMVAKLGRRFRYSLRTGLLLVTALSVWIGWNARIVHARRDHLAQLRGNGWTIVEHDDETSNEGSVPWIRRWLGDVEVFALYYSERPAEQQISLTQHFFPEAQIGPGILCVLPPP